MIDIEKAVNEMYRLMETGAMRLSDIMKLEEFGVPTEVIERFHERWLGGERRGTNTTVTELESYEKWAKMRVALK